jgi:hypothetical protein
MIGLPRMDEPASLLWIELPNRTDYGLDVLHERADRLRAECIRVRQSLDDPDQGPGAQRWHRCYESLYQDAQEVKTQGDKFGAAVLLLHLADVCRHMGRLGPSLQAAKEACEIFADWPENQQKHNQAVALYSLAIIHQLLGSEKEAWHNYELACDAFAAAAEQWRDRHETDRYEKCQEMVDKIRRQIDFIANARAGRGSMSVQRPMLLGSWPPDASPLELDRAVLDVEVKRVVASMNLRVNGRTFVLTEVHGGKSRQPVIEPDASYRILAVPDDFAHRVPQFRNAKYALVRQDQPALDFGVVSDEDDLDSPLWGEFERDPDGNIQFTVVYPRVPITAANVIGGEDLAADLTEMIVGVFKAA